MQRSEGARGRDLGSALQTGRVDLLRLIAEGTGLALLGVFVHRHAWFVGDVPLPWGAALVVAAVSLRCRVVRAQQGTGSGAAALALAFVLGKRDGFKRDPMRPHNMPLVLLGAGMLWFGWFGFNAGSALQASSLAASAMINTQIATACASLSWIIVEKFREGSATTLGIASGAIAGAVAITPACGFVNPIGALVIGLIAGATSAWAVTRKFKWGYDDSLDVVGVHGVGGFVGMIGIGILATKLVNDAGRDGLFSSGKFDLLVNQLTASFLTALYSFCVTYLIAYLIKKTIGFRVDREVEITGLDTSIHAESAYDVGIYTAR